MKAKGLFVALLIGLFSIISNAKENIELEVSFKENKVDMASTNIPVNMKIVNKSEQILDLEKLRGISFYFKRCSKIITCGVRGDLYLASAKLESRKLNKDEVYEFEINLADLYWKDAILSTIDLNYPKNFTEVPRTNKYFHAVIQVFDKNIKLDNYPSEIPIYKKFESNEVKVEFEPKSFR